MKTLVMVAHPELDSSSTHQFLMQAGQVMTQAEYRDIQQIISNPAWQVAEELEYLANFDRIIFQFSLYWYQAPATLKLWMDQVFSEDTSPQEVYKNLKNKELGIVVVAGSRAEAYQAGGKHHHTLSELLSPYQAFAQATGMEYLPIFAVHQFAHLRETDKFQLMVLYALYLETGTVGSFPVLQSYLLDKAKQIDSNKIEMTVEDEIIFKSFITELEARAEQISDFYQLNYGEW